MKSLVIFFLTLPSLVFSQNLVLIGGNLRNDNAPVWEKMVELAGGTGVAKIAIISASFSGTKEGERVIDNFVKIYGAKSAIEIPVLRKGPNSVELAELVKQHTGIFIVEDSDALRPWNIWNWLISIIRPTELLKPPSDVVCYEGPSFKRQNLIDTLRPFRTDSLVLSAIKSVLNNGGMVAGNAAIMSKPAMILDGDPISALVEGTRFFAFPRVPLTSSRKGGLGLLNIDNVIESELSEKGREVRLMRVLLNRDISRGIGVDENTAFIVNNPLSHPVGKVVTATSSTSGVLLMDVSNVPTTSIKSGFYENVKLSFFTVNDTIDLTTGDVIYASWKISIAGEEYFEKAIPSNDILSRLNPSQWRETARRLIDCKEINVTSYQPLSIIPVIPRVQVILDRKQAVGYGADIPGTTIYVPSYRQMLATIQVLGFF